MVYFTKCGFTFHESVSMNCQTRKQKQEIKHGFYRTYQICFVLKRFLNKECSCQRMILNLSDSLRMIVLTTIYPTFGLVLKKYENLKYNTCMNLKKVADHECSWKSLLDAWRTFLTLSMVSISDFKCDNYFVL